jgi:hypothetical protein
VDVGADTYSYAKATRIFCNDCHDGNSHTITPLSLCSKSDTDGYPNHKNAVIGGPLPGVNDLAFNPPSLTAPYGTSVDWTDPTFASTDMLCFICHDDDNSSRTPYAYTKGFVETAMTSGRDPGSGRDPEPMEDILDSYNASHGGHNVVGIGLDGGTGVTAQKLPCYECHDPHASADPEDGVIYNDALISSAGAYGTEIVNPYDPTDLDPAEDSFTFNGYDRSAAKEVTLCMTCHQSGIGAAELETGKKAVELQHPIDSDNLAFGFHADVHVEAIDANYDGGCLQSGVSGVGGCHYSPHNNSPYECLECHTESARDNNDLLDAVAHVDSEFGKIGFINDLTDDGDDTNDSDNGILSQHNIPYTPNEAAYDDRDMSLAENNGCLSCHYVLGAYPRKLLAVDGSVFTPATVSNREDLGTYDTFCEGCHDGSLDAFEVFDGLNPPTVDKYFTIAGHGRTTDFDSGNTAAKIGCLECHQYHGSTAYKLLPGNVQTDDYDARTTMLYDSGGRVVKGFDYADTGTDPHGDPLVETIATRSTIGALPDSTYIDYIDYTVEDRHTATSDNKERMAVKYADYDTNYAWDTYYDATSNSGSPTAMNPSGTQIFFGVSGDRIDTKSRVACDEELVTSSAPTEPVGFCDACHLYSDTTDGTTTTFDGMRTHAGLKTPTDCAGGPDYSTSVNFQKDCTECHDPHGSGYDGTTADNDNSYMIRGKIVTSDDGATIETFNVVLKAKSGADSLDEDDSDNKDDLCAVCHNVTDTEGEGADHNRSDNSGSAHQEDNDCTTCHFHSERFMPSGGCFECHPVGSDTMHKKHFNAIGGALGYVLPGETLEDADSFSPITICGNCHGDGAGSGATHNQSNNQSQPWPAGYEVYINIDDRTVSPWGDEPTYEGRPLPTYPQGGDTRCGDVSCHVNEDTAQDAVLPPYNRDGGQLPLFWNLHTDEVETTGTGSPNDSPLLSKVCQSCHDSYPADIRLFDAAGAVLMYGKRGSGAFLEYLSSSVDSAANYYGPVSGYGRGGHGDDRLSDPLGYDIPSAAATAPIDCSACHAGTGPTDPPHVPLSIANMDGNRLFDANLEDDTHSIAGLCNTTDCHDSAVYTQSYLPDPPPRTAWQHHPSYVEYVWTGNRITENVDDLPATTWTKDAAETYNQNAYGAALTIGADETEHSFSGNPDRFIDWYNRGAGWLPTDGQNNFASPANRGVFLGESGGNTGLDSPKAVLPLERYILNTGTSKIVLCVTCHNPHGTDLYVHDQHNVGQDIADHQMLRMQHEDSALCNACH